MTLCPSKSVQQLQMSRQREKCKIRTGSPYSPVSPTPVPDNLVMKLLMEMQLMGLGEAGLKNRSERKRETENTVSHFPVPSPVCKLPPLCIRVRLGHFAFGEHPQILEVSEWWWDMASLPRSASRENKNGSELVLV